MGDHPKRSTKISLLIYGPALLFSFEHHITDHQVMHLYDMIHNFVVQSFAAQPRHLPHLERTAYWAKVFEPHIDEAFLCAAVAHDIERAQSQAPQKLSSSDNPFTNIQRLTMHQQKGADIIRSYLDLKGTAEDSVDRICSLIAHHEVGGTPDQNFLRDLDSLSFFENNVEYFLDRQLRRFGAAQVSEKFKWMYARMTNTDIMPLAEPLYNEAMWRLGNKVDGIRHNP